MTVTMTLRSKNTPFGPIVLGLFGPIVPGLTVPIPVGMGTNSQPFWRNDAKLNLVDVLNELRGRGFTIADYDDSSWDAEPAVHRRRVLVEAMPLQASNIVVKIHVSHVQVEPYALWIYGRRENAHDETYVRSHTTTAKGLLRTVDAFFAGMHAAGLETTA